MPDNGVCAIAFVARVALMSTLFSICAVHGALGQSSSSFPPPAFAVQEKLLEFEVASVRPSEPGDAAPAIQTAVDGIRIRNCTVQFMMGWLYGVHGFGDRTIQGLPKWASSERYNIEARVPGSDVELLRTLPSERRDAQLKLMLQRLLAERFQLATHNAAVEVPAFDLVVAGSSPKLRIGQPDPKTLHGTMTALPGRILAKGTTMERLAWVLGLEVGRTVNDRTGLTGTYDFSLEWQPEVGTGADSPQAENADADSQQASLFSALQEQLGLKLKPSRQMGEAIVVDRLERPAPN